MRSVSEFITSSFGQNHPLTKNDSIVGGKFMNILNGNCRWLRRNNRIVGSRNRCRHHELLEPGRGKYKEIVILGIAGIAELVRDVARGQESIAGLKHKSLVSDGSLKFSGKNKVHFVLARMGMTGHPHPRSEAYLEQAVGSTC